jgi:twitching motility protein PilT
MSRKETRPTLMNDSLDQAKIEDLKKLLITSPQEGYRQVFPFFFHADWNVRKIVSGLISKLGEPGFCLLKSSILKEEDPDRKQTLCYWAATQILEQGSPKAEALEFVFQQGRSHIQKTVLEGLENGRAEGSMELLFQALGSQSWDVREKACKLLVQKGKTCVSFLEQQFASANSDQRFWTFRILAILLKSGAIQYFSRFLKSQGHDEQLQIFAVSNLGEIDDPRVIKTLVNFLRTDSFLLAEEVYRSLLKLAPTQRTELLNQLKDQPDPKTLEILLRVIEMAFDASILLEVESLFTDPDHRTRYLAVTHLGNFQCQETARLLIRCFSDERWVIRKLAKEKVVALATFSIPPLLETLKNNQEDLIFWTLRSLVDIREESTLPAVARLMNEAGPNIKTQALEAILKLDTEESCEIYLEAFDNDTWEIRQYACDTFGKLSHQPLAYLLWGALSENHNIQFWSLKALEKLEMIGAPSFLEQVAEITDNPQLYIKNLRLADQKTLSHQLLKPQPALSIIQESVSEAAESKTITTLSTTGEKLRDGKSEEWGILVQDEAYPLNASELFEQCYNLGASDIHLKIGTPPVIRVKGKLSSLKLEPIKANQIRIMAHELLSEGLLERLLEQNQVDASYQSLSGIRLRLNIYKTMSGFEVAGRFISDKIPTFESLNLSASLMQRITTQENGLVIISGPTGSGKSSTLASMIHYLNLLTHKHIICIEDPVEYVHTSKLCHISQREVFSDVISFPVGIRATLREDPDVILIGELRDKESVETALTLAGTGHLVFTSLHAPSCTTAVEQLMDFFPADQQGHIRKQISFNLRSIISQRLLKHKSGHHRVPAYELMITTPAIKNIIRDGKTEQLPTAIETSKKDGMISMDQCLKMMVQEQQIELEEAWPHVTDPKTFRL